jgi:hypothetical protein
VETLEVSRWLGCGNLRGHRWRGRRIEIPLVVAISGSSADTNFNNNTGTATSDSSIGGDFNNHGGTAPSDSSTGGNFNNHSGTAISDFSIVGDINSNTSAGGSSGYTAADSSDSGPDHDSNGHNNTGAVDVCNSFDKSERSSDSAASRANCQIHWISYNDCSWREREAFLQIRECRTGFD